MQPHPELPQAFAKLGIEGPLLRGLAKAGFVEPSDIQRELIPQVLAGRDVLGQARTGTGKTAAFGLPIMQQIDLNGPMQALVLAPTRELAAQIVGELRRLGEFTTVHCVPVYGGAAVKQQVAQLGRKPHIVVGTPGRVLDLLGRRVLNFDGVRWAVLDEVDRMLDIGFRDDIKRILQHITPRHQTVFVSATLDAPIKTLARQFMHDPIEVNVSRDEVTVERIEQRFCSVEPWDKFRMLRRLIEIEKPTLAIIFTNTKHGARKLARKLFDAGIEAKEIHGDLVQQKREKIMERFRRHKLPVLVATDLAARGIDVSAISHIVNYDLPKDPEIYVHRIGRTARMGAFGKAISFATREDGHLLTAIEKLVNRVVERMDVPGFEPSGPPSDLREYRRPMTDHEKRVQAIEAMAPAAAAIAQPASLRPPPRTLGSKFPVKRRGRRR